MDWSKEKCQEEASKYKNKSQFQKNNYNAYNCAFLNNWCNIEVSGVKVPKNYKPEIGDYMSNEYGVGGYMDDKSIIDS